MIKLADTKNCTGCSACANVCPHTAITMRPDEEGFSHPAIDVDKCVECHACEKSCPIISGFQYGENNPDTYAVIYYPCRKKSSSGGAFSLLAEWMLSVGGVVYGASIDDQLKVRHVRVGKVEELYLLRGSKYVQSEIGHAYHDVRDDLKRGNKVLFTGTPCQVAGLYGFLHKSWEGQLYTIDIVCHGVPSQKAFDAYLEKLKKSTALRAGGSCGNIEGFSFRKLDSWDYRPAVQFTERKPEILCQERNAYMSAFFRGLLFKESCFSCPYAKSERVGTFTIADFWGIGKHGKPFKKNVSSGVSVLLDNRGALDKIKDELPSDVYIEKRTFEEAAAENENLNSPFLRPTKRDTAVLDLVNPDISLYQYAVKYHLLEPPVKHFVKKMFKNMIYALGCYNLYKTIIYKIK